MFALISILPSVEKYLETKKFLMYYLMCGIFAGLFNSFLTNEDVPMVGASGSIWGMVVMFAFIYPNEKLNLMFIPYGIKAKWLIGAMAILERFLAINSLSDGVAHYAHIGGGIMGTILIAYEKFLMDPFRIKK
jgi:membrane associated rhomboid family serine protease